MLILTYVSYRQRGGFVAWPIADSSVRPWHPLERDLKSRPSFPRCPHPTRSSPGAGGASVSCRSDINNDATSLVVIDSTPVCHGYGDALSPEWPRQSPTPKTPTAILRYKTMMAGIAPRGIHWFSIIVLRLVPASVRPAFSLTGT